MPDASIKAYFGGDTTQLQSAIMSAHAMTNKFAKDSAKVFEEISLAEASLASFRKQAEVQRSSGFQRNVILQREILELNRQISSIEGQTAEKLNLQLQLEQKILALEQNIAAAARQHVSAKAATARETAATVEKTTVLQRSIGKIVGLGPALKGLFAGLGIASVQMLVDKLVSGFREAADRAKEIEQLTAKVADANIENNRARLTDEEKLILISKDRDRIEREISENRGKTDEDIKRSLEDQLRLASIIKEEARLTAKIEEAAHKASEEAFEKRSRLQEQIRKANDEGLKQEKRMREEINDAFEKGLSRAETVNKKLFEQRLEQMKPAERLVALERERNELLEVQKLFLKGTTDFKELQVEINEINLRIEKERKDIAEKTAKEEKKITDEKKAQTAIGIAGIKTGRQLGDVSDETLQEISRRNRAQEQQLRNPIGFGVGSGLGQSVEAARLEQEAINAEKELEFRRNFLRDLAAGGVSLARQTFKGDPTSFDRVLQQLTSGLSKDDEVIKLLEKTNNLLSGKFRNQ